MQNSQKINYHYKCCAAAGLLLLIPLLAGCQGGNEGENGTTGGANGSITSQVPTHSHSNGPTPPLTTGNGTVLAGSAGGNPPQDPPPSVSTPASGPDGGALANWKPRAIEFERSGSVPPRVALTFDAGADAIAVPLILQTLQEHHVHCTFFLTGQFCKDFPKQARMIADAGMELGNHSYSHPHFPHLTDARMRSELERAEAAIQQTCGRGARPLFRFPYGEDNRRTLNIVASEGYQPIYWTIDSLDSLPPPKSADFVADRIIKRIKPGYIVLMHVSAVGSAEALPRIFKHLDDMGVQVVPVSQLLLSQPPIRSNAKVASRESERMKDEG